MALDLSKLKTVKPTANTSSQSLDIDAIINDVYSRNGNDASIETESAEEEAKTVSQPVENQQKEWNFWDSWAGDAIEKINAGGAMVGKNLFGLLDKGVKSLESAGLATRGGLFGDISKHFEEEEKSSINASDRYKGKDFKQLWNEGDYSGAVGQIALEGAQSIPMSIGAMASTYAGVPIAGLVGIGSLVANEKYDELDESTPNMPEFNKIANAIITGTAEGASEMLGAGAQKVWMSSLYKSLGKEKAEKVISDGILGQLKKHFKDFGIFYEPVVEGIEEVSSRLAENVTDIMTGADPTRKVSDGLFDSFVYGTGGGAYFTGASLPAYAKLQYNKVKSSRDLKNAQKAYTQEFSDDDYMLGLMDEMGNGTYEEKKQLAEVIVNSPKLTDKQKEVAIDYINADINYKSYRTPEAKLAEKEQQREDEIRQQMVVYDTETMPLISKNGNIQQAKLNGGEEVVAIIDGDVAYTTNEDNENIIDKQNSSDKLYYIDVDGKVKVATPQNVTSVVQVANAMDMRSAYEQSLRDNYAIQDQQAESQRVAEEQATINNGESVSFVNPDNGKQMTGVVLNINPNVDTATVEVDGKMLNVPKDLLTKTIVQQVEPENTEVIEDEEIKPTYEEGRTGIESEVKEETITDNVPSPIVYMEDGVTPDFVKSGAESSRQFISDKYGDKAGHKIAKTLEYKQKELEKKQKSLEKAEQEYDDAPIGQEGKLEEAFNQAKAEYANAKEEVDFWQELNTPPEAAPITAEEASEIVEQQPVEQQIEQQTELQPEATTEVEQPTTTEAVEQAEAIESPEATEVTAESTPLQVEQPVAEPTQVESTPAEQVAETTAPVKPLSTKEIKKKAKKTTEQLEPMTAEELAAYLLSTGSIRITRESYIKELGVGNNEAKSMIGLFRKPENGGVSIERAGELLMLAAEEEGYNFFDETDANAGRNAIIEVLSSARTRGELSNYIANNRAEQAKREAEAEYNEYAAWTEANYHMTPEEYEMYIEILNLEYEQTPEDAIQHINNEMADEIAEREKKDNNLANKNENEEIERNDEGGIGNLSEGSGSILQGAQPIQTGRVSDSETGYEEANRNINSQHETSQESTSGTTEVVSPSIEATNVSRMEDIENRLTDIENELYELNEQLEDETLTALEVAEIYADIEALNSEIRDLEAEYKGLRSFNDESNAILESQGSSLRFRNALAISNKAIKKPIKSRIQAWTKNGIKVNVIDTIDDVQNEEAKAAIESGEIVPGWYETKSNEVFIYVPHVADVADLDATILHEALSHKGLRGLLGQDKFDELCDKVWDAMPQQAKDAFLDYVGTNFKSEQARQRAAADEFIAHIAEKENLTPQEQDLWDKIVQWFKDLFSDYKGQARDILNSSTITPQDLSNLIRLSQAEFRKSGNESVGNNEKTRFRFIGEIGAANLDKAEEATIRLDNLAVAREMETAGKDARTIKMATGWERGADKLWRYEVEDVLNFEANANADFKKRNPNYVRYVELMKKDNANQFGIGKALSENEQKEYNSLKEIYGGKTELHRSRKLKDYIDDEELFKSYPQLKEISVEITDSIPINIKGVYKKSDNKIIIGKTFKKGEIRNFLAHEIQHAIQDIEGFAEGGNLSSAYEKIDNVKYTLGINGKASINDIVSYLENGFETPTQNKAINEMAKKEGYDNAIDYVRSLNPLNYYRRISGEVEARNVEKRLNMTPEERRATLASETEDVSREDQIFLNNAIEGVLGETRFRTLEEVNAEFNDNLQRQIDGTLPKGFVYQLGYPSDVLRSAGINNLPIELVASRLVDKSMQENHPFDLKEVENLPEAIQNPLAVFVSATKVGSNVIFTELRHGGKNFVAILRVKENKKKIEVNQIRSLYPKNTSGIIEWINSDLATYMDKKRMIEWIENQRNESLSKPQSNSVEVRKQLVSAANIIKDFENPNISDGNSTRFRKSSNLKESLGNEYDATMTSIYDSMTEEEKGNYGSNPVKAAEEYSTNIAESMNDLSAIKKLSAIIKGALEKMGFDVKLSDGDAMYALWKSGNAIKDSDTAFEAMEKASKDFAVQQLTEEYDVLFRKKKPLDALNLSQDQKNKLQGDIQSKMELFQEAYADRMIAVKKLQEEIEAKTGKKLPDHMNVYVFENTLSSRNDYERRVFEQSYKEPLIEAVKSMTEKGANQRDIENYVMLKHALERRDVMMQKDLDEYIKSLPQPDPALIQAKQDALLQKDYSGMTGILADIKGIRRETFESQMEANGESISDYIKEAEDYVSNFESTYNTNGLWDKIHAINDFNLKKWYDSGMINKSRYEEIKNMYNHYVPLRGFDEAVAHDVYDYYSDKDIPFDNPLRTAKGRTSRPDDPFATMMQMGNSSIIGGNKNQMKLHLFRLAMAGHTDKLTVSKQWYEVTKDVNGQDILTPVYPKYDADPDVYRQNIEAFEQQMEILEQSGQAVRGKAKLNIPFKSSQYEAEEHCVRVKMNGEDYVVYVNGNPKVSQAINGLNNPLATENKFIKWMEWFNRQMSANFTARNPAFVASNLVRDVIWASTTLGVKEGRKYQSQFVKNFPKSSKALLAKIKKGKKWKSDPADQMSVYLEEFLKYGGRTGYTAMYNIDEYKKEIQKSINPTKWQKFKDSTGKLFDFAVPLNEFAEDITRFNCFVTSREMGKSAQEAAYDAKEVSVNFNRKGSGAMGARYFTSWYIFFNASVQALSNTAGMVKNNPKGVAALFSTFSLAGSVIPLLLLGLGDDEDLEKYMGLPDYVRKNNICIPMPGTEGFIKIPLPIELRAFYGIGDAAIRYVMNYDKGVEALSATALGMLDIMPLNPAGGTSTFVPSSLQPLYESYVSNYDFTGKPIAKINPYNENNPEHLKVYKNTNAIYVKASEYINMILGGDDALRKFETIEAISGADLANPASVEHLFESYLGGAFTFYNQLYKTLGMVAGAYDFNSRDLPVINRFFDSGSIDGTMIKTNERYYDWIEKDKELVDAHRSYEKLIESSPSLESAKYAEKLKEFEESEDWKKHEEVEEYQQEIKDYMDELKEETDEQRIKEIKSLIDDRKTMIVKIVRR